MIKYGFILRVGKLKKRGLKNTLCNLKNKDLVLQIAKKIKFALFFGHADTRPDATS